MESIVKMGVPGKTLYGKKEQSGGAAGAVLHGRPDACAEVKPDAPKEAAARNAGPSDAGSAGLFSVNGEQENPKAEEKRREEQKRLAAEERILQKKRSRHYRLIMNYAIAAIVISYMLIQLAGNLNTVIAAVGKGLRLTGSLLRPLFWGFVLAYILNPVVNICEKELRRSRLFGKKRGSRRGPAVAVTCVLTFLALFLLLSVVASAITRNLKLASLDDLVIMVQSFAESLGSLQQTIITRLSSMSISTAEAETAVRQIGRMIGGLSNGLSAGITGTISHIGRFLTNLLFAVIFAIYFLLDGEGLMRYWNRVLLAVCGRKVRRNLHVLANDADLVFSGYIRGQLIDAMVMAVFVSAALSLIGVRYAVIIGVLSGIGNLIPYVGPVVAYGSTIIVCLVSGDPRRLLVAIVVLFVIQTVDGNVINPRLLSSSIDVHPMLVIAALIIGGAVGGIGGMLFAVPVAAFLRIQFDKIIDSLLKTRMPARNGTAKRKKTKPAVRKKKPAGPE